MSDDSRVFAIVPAAGRSRRMGQPKQLLDVGGQPMLRGVLETLAAAQTQGVMVVTRRAFADALGASATDKCHVVWNEDESTEMIDSVRIGLRAWREREVPAGADGVLICPADHAGLTVDDFDACIRAFKAAPTMIVIAAHHGRRGHPIIFPAELIAFVESPGCEEGLHALPRTYADRVMLVERSSPAVTRDVDVPADFERPG